MTPYLIRKTLAIILGALIGSFILLAVGFIANTIYPTPPELMDPATPEAVAQRVAATTTSTWLTVIFGLSLGAFFGSLLGAKLAGEKSILITTSISLLLSLWAFYTFYIVYPEYLWVPAAMLLSTFLFSYLGGLMVKKADNKDY